MKELGVDVQMELDREVQWNRRSETWTEEERDAWGWLLTVSGDLSLPPEETAAENRKAWADIAEVERDRAAEEP